MCHQPEASSPGLQITQRPSWMELTHREAGRHPPPRAPHIEPCPPPLPPTRLQLASVRHQETHKDTRVMSEPERCWVPLATWHVINHHPLISPAFLHPGRRPWEFHLPFEIL